MLESEVGGEMVSLEAVVERVCSVLGVTNLHGTGPKAIEVYGCICGFKTADKQIYPEEATER